MEIILKKFVLDLQSIIALRYYAMFMVTIKSKNCNQLQWPIHLKGLTFADVIKG